MKDVFYTILAVWLIWRVVDAFGMLKTANKNSRRQTSMKEDVEGKTTIKYSSENKKGSVVNEGEYVDFEEIE